MKKNNTVLLGVIAIVVFGLIVGIVSLTQNWGKSKDVVDTEAAVKKLDSLYAKLSVNRQTPKQDPNFQPIAEDEEQISVLPDISEYPFVVNPTTDDFLTIYSSPEKAGVGYESWLVDVANKFNQSGATVDSKPVSVAVRSISSGLGVDFITSGKYTPDVFMPSNELWGDILASKDVNVNKIENRIAGNVAGIVLTKRKNDEIIKKYGAINPKTIADSVMNKELAIGYTNPMASSTGLNFVLEILRTFDNNILSDNAVNQFRAFQDNVPYLAYNTMQMKESALRGTLDGFLLEYQTYINSPELKSYIFTPFGVRHDQPVYEIGNLSSTKRQITLKFVEFCKTSDSQRMALDKGFNGLEDYAYSGSKTDGATILQVQTMYQKEKGGSSDLTALFVADVSGSMEGSPILNLKASLNHAIGVINSNTNVGLVTFSDSVNIAVPLARFDNTQRSYFSNAVRTMNAGGGTAMFDAIVVAQKMLMDAKMRDPNTKLMLFVLTDGEANRGYNFKDIEKMTAGLRIPIYTIGYNANIDVLKKVSNINEAATMNADSDNVIYRLENLFNAQM